MPAAEQQELPGMLGPMKVDIVEVDGPQTGTPLPDVYEPAPPIAAS